MLVADGQHRGNCDGPTVARIGSGTELTVHKVLLFRAGTAGTCRRVLGTVYSGREFRVELPSCFIHHPWPYWFDEWDYKEFRRSGNDEVITRLGANEEYLVPCQ